MPLSGNKAKILLRVLPGAVRNELLGFREGVLRVRVKAPPEKGRANQELVSFLSQILGLPKGALTIIKGHTSRDKVIAIDGLSQDEVMKRFSSCGDAGTSKSRRR